MNYLFPKFFELLQTGTFKNCTITYPKSHNNHHILRWYEWDLLVFCKQRSLQLAAIRTFSIIIVYVKCLMSPFCSVELFTSWQC